LLQEPWGRASAREWGDDEIDIIASDEGFVVLRAIREELGAFLPGGGDETRGVFGLFFDHITNGDDLPVGCEQILEEVRAATTDADHADARFTLLKGDVGHSFAIGGQGRLLRNALLNGSCNGCGGEASLHEAAARPGSHLVVLHCHL